MSICISLIIDDRMCGSQDSPRSMPPPFQAMPQFFAEISHQYSHSGTQKLHTNLRKQLYINTYVTRSAKTRNNPANNISQYKAFKKRVFKNISFVFIGPLLTKNSLKQLKLRYLLVGNLTRSSKT